MFAAYVYPNRYRLRLEQENVAMPDATKMEDVERQIATRQTAMIQTHDDTALSMDLLDTFSDRVMRESHTFSGAPADILSKIGLANSDDIIKGEEALNVPINLVDWYMHETGKEGNRNGEVYNVLRTVLFDKNGKRYSTTSDWVAKDVYRIACMLGKRTLDPPYACKLVMVQGGKFGKVYRLVPAQTG